ncbi:hypothetical protein LSUB1_G008589 [Lachnellula subtilissima]|uniref:Endonuclease/exonuclease/phosphatase domain-containing protein n=1 Tax=Lachnellula subtilissima TaxID=602034 RepID=A0A8H8RC37_9HELO|nr:hypothetical protein LSUB1_G008589 [Lachnellula subtilissima]
MATYHTTAIERLGASYAANHIRRNSIYALYIMQRLAMPTLSQNALIAGVHMPLVQLHANTKILQVNLNSAAHNTESALQVAIELDINIILVQEPYIITDLSEIRSISHSLFTQLFPNRPSLDITPRTIAYIARLYRPRVTLASKSPYDSDFQVLDIIDQDHTIKDPLYKARDIEGIALADWIDHHDLALLNTPGIGTFHRSHIARPTNINLTLAHRSIANHIQDWAIIEDIGSNHLGIVFTIQGSQIGLADPQTTRFDTKRAN